MRGERRVTALLPRGDPRRMADYSENPVRIASRTDDSQLESALAPLASDTVTVIAGFTELGPDGALSNSAAICQGGHVAGLYRKIHPALRHSVYQPGRPGSTAWATGPACGRHPYLRGNEASRRGVVKPMMWDRTRGAYFTLRAPSKLKANTR